MDKNSVMKNLRKELQIQEKLKKDITEKTIQLNKSKKQSAMYRKWLKKLDQLEINQIKRMNEIDKKMQAALVQEKDQSSEVTVKKELADSETTVMQRLFEVEGENNSSEKGL